MVQIHYFLRKETSHITKTFLYVLVGCQNINVVGNFCLNLDMQNLHSNILI